jgi:hypothetical protein
METADDFCDECLGALVCYVSSEDVEEYLLVDRGEELADVALQYPGCAGVILGNLVRERAKTVERLMRPPAHPARIRIGDKRSVEEWVQDAMNRMMHEPIAHGCFVNVSGFGVADPEMMVRTVTIRADAQIAMERKDIVHEPQLELLHVYLVALAADEFLPG